MKKSRLKRKNLTKLLCEEGLWRRAGVRWRGRGSDLKVVLVFCFLVIEARNLSGFLVQGSFLILLTVHWKSEELKILVNTGTSGSALLA